LRIGDPEAASQAVFGMETFFASEREARRAALRRSSKHG
jgi:hypothetical protein